MVVGKISHTSRERKDIYKYIYVYILLEKDGKKKRKKDNHLHEI